MRLALLLIAQVVTLDVPDPQTEGRLALRLLDEGYEVVASQTPSKNQLHLRQTTRGFELRWQGQTEAVHARTPAVSEVAAIQKVVLALAHVSPTPSVSARSLRLAWLPGLSAAARAQWANRLLTQGRTLTLQERAGEGLCLTGPTRSRPGPVNEPCASVVAPPAHRPAAPASPASTASRGAEALSAPRPPSKVPRITAAPSVPPLIRTTTLSAARPMTPPITRSPPRSPPAGLIDGPVALTATAAVSGGTAPGSPQAGPPLGPKAGPMSARALPRSAHRLSLQAAVGLTPHTEGVDPTVAVQGTVWWSWFGARVAGLGLFASAGELSVFEGVLSLGPALRWSLHPDWELGGGLLVGARMHRWQLGEDEGLRTDLAVDLPLSVHWRPTERLFVGLTARPAVHTRSRRHTLGDEVLWQRGVLRFSVMLSVGGGVL